MWLELTQYETNEAVWVNSDLVTHIVELPKKAGGPGSRIFFCDSRELVVKEPLDVIMERMQLA